jgi:DnaJ-class molecular chaperone
VVSVADHPDFTRKGDDLHSQLKIDLFTAILGGEIQAPTLNGEVMLHIPPGTQPGRIFRLEGKGLPCLNDNGKRGSQFICVQVEIPRRLTEEQRQLLQQLAETQPKL